MTTKLMLLQTVKRFPDDASIEDAMGKFLFLAKIERFEETGCALSEEKDLRMGGCP